MAEALDIKGALITSGHKFRKEVLMAMIVALESSLQYMTLRKGIRGKETVGSLRSEAELRPYRTAKDATNTASMMPRELETFLGDVVEEFDPYTIYETIYGEPISVKRVDLKIVKSIVVAMALSISEKLNYALFVAKRNAAGNTTKDLFNGFDTIIEAEKAKKEEGEADFMISAAKGNLVTMAELTEANIGDEFLKAYRAMSDVMKERNILLYLPYKLKEMYDDWHAANYGTANFSGTKYEQEFLRGTNGQCRFVTLVGMRDAKNVIFSVKKNMLVGVDQLGDKERFEINRADNPKTVQFFLTMYFGTNFESIDSRDFCCSPITFPAAG